MEFIEPARQLILAVRRWRVSVRPTFDERLNAIAWGDYHTAYGPAVGVPEQLRRLAGPDRKAALDATHELWCGLCHQHVQVGSAAVPALSFLLEVLDTADRDMTVELLDILLGFAIGVNWLSEFLTFLRLRAERMAP